MSFLEISLRIQNRGVMCIPCFGHGIDETSKKNHFCSRMKSYRKCPLSEITFIYEEMRLLLSAHEVTRMNK